jgi:hypothetical protein
VHKIVNEVDEPFITVEDVRPVRAAFGEHSWRFGSEEDELLQALLIFALRIIDMSLSTMRFMMIARGYKLLAGIFGFFGAIVFISQSARYQNLDDWGI